MLHRGSTNGVTGIPGDPSLRLSTVNPPPGLRARRFRIAEDDFVLFELPLARLPVGRRLPRVEAEVLQLVLQGRSNTEIAAARRRSPRTIANEVAHLLRKLGVRSRIELFALVARSSCRGGGS